MGEWVYLWINSDAVKYIDRMDNDLSIRFDTVCSQHTSSDFSAWPDISRSRKNPVEWMEGIRQLVIHPGSIAGEMICPGGKTVQTGAFNTQPDEFMSLDMAGTEQHGCCVALESCRLMYSGLEER